MAALRPQQQQAEGYADGDTELAVVFQDGKVMSASINRDSKDSGE